MLKFEVLILEFLSVNRFAPGTVVLGEITSLKHELWNDSVEDCSLISEAVLSGTELSEISGSLRYICIKQLESDSSSFFPVDFNVEEGIAHFMDIKICL